MKHTSLVSHFLPLRGLLIAYSHSGPWVSSVSDMPPIQVLNSSMAVSLMEVADVFDQADLVEVVMDPPKGRHNKVVGGACLTSVLQRLIMSFIEGTSSLLWS